MNLEEFMERLFKVIDMSVPKYVDWKELDVVVTTGEHSAGSRASSKVKLVHRGIDWERNQIRVETEDNLVKKSQYSEQELLEKLRKVKSIAHGVRSYLKIVEPRDVRAEMDAILATIGDV